ncbi:MAG: hypothetical protein QM270_10510, partial [Bacillota bacterium]|nr:hypothetical protein [Bacillota bacterium]
MRRNASRGKRSHKLLLSLLIIGSMLFATGFGAIPVAATEESNGSLLAGEDSQGTTSALGGPERTNDLEIGPTIDALSSEETDSSEEPEAQAAAETVVNEESCSREPETGELESEEPEQEESESEESEVEESEVEESEVEETGTEEITESETHALAEHDETTESTATDPTTQNETMQVNEAETIGEIPLSVAVEPNMAALTVTLKFSVVERGKPDSEQLTGSLTQLIHNDEQFMENWEVAALPVERVLGAGEYNFSMVTLPDGFAFNPGITFRVNDDLSVDIADDSGDPDPGNWTWIPLEGDTIRLEHERGAPFLFRNIDLMNSGVELEGGTMLIELGNGVTRTWDSGPDAEILYLAPGTEGVYSEYTAPDGYVGSDPIPFKIDSSSNLFIQDPDGRWFMHVGNTIAMENIEEAYAGNQKYHVTLGVREYGSSGIPSLPGAVVKLQRLDPYSSEFYDMPWMQWMTGTENRTVPLFYGEYRLVVLDDPEGYEYYFGTGIFLILENGDGIPPSFHVLFQPLDGSSPVWWESEEWGTYIEYTEEQLPVTLKFSVVERGKPDSEQLTGSHVQLIHNDEQFMEDWFVPVLPVEKDLYPGTYCVGMITLPDGFAFSPGITFRVNDNLCVDIAEDSSDPDPGNWTWIPLQGDMIRLEHDRGVPFLFRNIDLMNSGVELENGRMLLEFSNGVVRTWNSGPDGEVFYLAPGTEGVYSEYTAPAGYAGSGPIQFKIDSSSNLFVQDLNGRWFMHVGNTIAMENIGQMFADYGKFGTELGVREYGNPGSPSLPGAVVKLQRLNPDTSEFYDVPGMQWVTGTESRIVPLFVGEYRLVAVDDPDGYEYYYGTGIFLILEGGDNYGCSFHILIQPLDGSSPVWWESDVWATFLEYRAAYRIAVFRTGTRTSYTVGETVALAARAENGTTPYYYQFYVIRSNGTRVILRDYALSNTYNWNPVTPDTYQVGVNVRDASGEIINQEKTVTVKLPEEEQLRIAVFRAGTKSTYTVGETVALAARAEGGKTPYQYQFYVIRSNGARVILRDYALSNTFNWKPRTPDTYQVGVNVKDAAGTIVYQEKTVTV